MLKDKKEIEQNEEEVLTIEKMTGKNDDNTPTNPFEEESVNDKVSLLAINELLDIKKLKTISRVKMEQVPVLTQLYLFADIFEVPLVKDLADNILQLQISVNGLGRKELVSLVQQRDMTNELNNQIKNVTSKNIFK